MQTMLKNIWYVLSKNIHCLFLSKDSDFYTSVIENFNKFHSTNAFSVKTRGTDLGRFPSDGNPYVEYLPPNWQSYTLEFSNVSRSLHPPEYIIWFGILKHLNGKTSKVYSKQYKFEELGIAKSFSVVEYKKLVKIFTIQLAKLIHDKELERNLNTEDDTKLLHKFTQHLLLELVKELPKIPVDFYTKCNSGDAGKVLVDVKKTLITKLFNKL